MAIITTYPFKKAPLNKKDEIIISDAASSNPHFKTKTTDIETLSDYVVSLGTFVFTQNIPSATWTIQHDLNKFPSVTVIDSSNTVNIGTVTYSNSNQIVITFSSAFSGIAYLN